MLIMPSVPCGYLITQEIGTYLIVFSTGEKVNPMGMEEVIGSHADVSAAFLVGQSRRRSSLLIEASKKPHVARRERRVP